MNIDDLTRSIIGDVRAIAGREPADTKTLELVAEQLYPILRRRLCEPFHTGDDQWGQGYEVGRATGLASGQDDAAEQYEKIHELLRSTAEQFKAWSPWLVKHRDYHVWEIVGRDGRGLARVQYESDADALVELLNKCVEFGKS